MLESSSASPSRGPPRIAMLCIHPAPYRDPTFAVLARRGKVSADILMMYEQDRRHPEWALVRPPYHYYSLGRRLGPAAGDRLHLAVLSRLARGRYDALLVPGYARPTSRLALLYALVNRLPIILSADSTLSRDGEGSRRPVRQRLVRTLLHRVAAVWVPGHASRLYMRHHGVPDDRIFEGAYCLDGEKFLAATRAAQLEGRAWRRAQGIPEDATVFLHVGHITRNRRQELLCRTFADLAPRRQGYLVLVGRGRRRAAIEEWLGGRDAPSIRLLPPVPFKDLPILYAASDVYVHPGQEPYSTAMELAAIAGLAIIATPEVGYVWDLQARGARPLVSPIDDADLLRANLIRLLDEPAVVRAMGRGIEAAAVQRTPAWAAGQLEKAALVAISGPAHGF